MRNASFSKILHPYYLVVFATGAAVLIVEVVAVRVLTPFFGNTIFSVSSVITTVLAALSVGYYAGGKLSDRYPSPSLFFTLVFVGGFFIFLTYLLKHSLLPILSETFSLVAGPLITSLLLFFAPAALLGFLSPFAIKLLSDRFPADGVGHISGTVFFWSTAGSILGSLAAGFLLIPHLATDTILAATGIILMLVAGTFTIRGAQWRLTLVYAAVILAAVATFAALERTSGSEAFAGGTRIYKIQGRYAPLAVYDGMYQGEQVRFLRRGRNISSGVFRDNLKDDTRLVFDYLRFFRLHRITEGDLRKALVLGGGAYTVPRKLLAEYPTVSVDAVEIDPSLLPLAQRYFGFPTSSPQFSNHVADARQFLKRTEDRYDLIFMDIFGGFQQIPFHLTTRQFFQEAKSRLDTDGIFVANVLGTLAPTTPSFTLSEMRTFRSVFENSAFFAVHSPHTRREQNIMFVGRPDGAGKDIDLTQHIPKEHREWFRTVATQRIDISQYTLADHSLLTDNYAPVNYMRAHAMR